MKLFNKYNRILIALAASVFLIAGVGIYYTLQYVQLQQADSDLVIEERQVKLFIQKYDDLPPAMSVDDQLVQFIPVAAAYTKRHFARAQAKDQESEREDFRQLFFGAVIKGKQYQVVISKSLEESDDLIQAAFAITGISILLILIALLLINRYVLKNLWRPFYQTLDAVKSFKIGADTHVQFPTTDTEEFNTMIQTLDRSTHQAKTDFLALKTFSENASHEIQTPIAIIQSKIDMLMQYESLTEQHSNDLQTISSAVDQLSRLNSSLLLMAKIENRQFSSTQEISLDNKINEKLADFQELWQMKGITMDAIVHPSTIHMNNELADILFNNLFSNAIWHNNKNGRVVVRLEKNSFMIGNTGEEQALDRAKIFQRFYKPAQTGPRNGLGLSIVKQISEAAHIALDYSYENRLHLFRLSWNN